MFHLGYQKPIHAALVCLDTNMLIASYLVLEKGDADKGLSFLQRALLPFSFFFPAIVLSSFDDSMFAINPYLTHLNEESEFTLSFSTFVLFIFSFSTYFRPHLLFPFV